MSAVSSPSGHARPPPSLVEPLGDGWLALDVCADDIVRVAYARDRRFFERSTLATAPMRCSHPEFGVQLDDAAGTKTLTTAKLGVRIERASGRLTFLDREGQPILAERQRTLTPVTVQGESTFEVRQEWEPHPGEALYGLGQHQQGLLDLAGVDLDLRQYNSEIFVPFLVSSRGYGILWDNTSFTRYGDLGAAVPLPAAGGLPAVGSGPGERAPRGAARPAAGGRRGDHERQRRLVRHDPRERVWRVSVSRLLHGRAPALGR